MISRPEAVIHVLSNPVRILTGPDTLRPGVLAANTTLAGAIFNPA
jgi:hypothetical protein